MLKKYSALLLCALAALCGLTACGSGEPAANAGDQEAGSLSIVATIFPEYDWVREIVGETGAADVTLLLDNGVDLHNYQLTVDDIVQISNCDLFLYVGGESDEWVEDALKEAANPNLVALNLLEVLGGSAKEEELAEGMEAEDGADGEEGPEYDEHVWLSLRNAQVFCDAIADTLAELDPKHAEDYQANAAAYEKELAALDADYGAAVKAGAQDTLLFGDRFPFRYLTEDYGLNYYAAFAGCSAESEASFETILFLAGKADELGLGSVLVIEGSDGKLARAIVSNTASQDQQILTLDSMQATTLRDGENGVTYLSVMEKNLAVLKAALEA